LTYLALALSLVSLSQAQDPYMPQAGDVCSNGCSTSDPQAWCGLYKEDITGRLLRCAEFTRYDQICVDECRSKGESYTWCLTNTYSLSSEEWWEYCSLSGLTINKETCTDKCAKHGKSYFWCHTSSSWDYCSPPGVVVPVQYTRKGVLCLTECRQEDENYHWCRKSLNYCSDDSCDEDWDYCSLDEDHDRFNYKCKEKCNAKEGTDYYWCYRELEEEKWEYCSPKYELGVHLSDHVEVTRYGERCRNICGLKGEDYYWCNQWGDDVSDYWDYCSPPNTTIKGEKCKDQCGKKGNSYFWCKTDSSWDYCSPVFIPGVGLLGDGKRIEQEAILLLATFAAHISSVIRN